MTSQHEGCRAKMQVTKSGKTHSHLSIVSHNQGILLVILFLRATAAVSALDSRVFLAFKGSTFEARFLALGG